MTTTFIFLLLLLLSTSDLCTSTRRDRDGTGINVLTIQRGHSKEISSVLYRLVQQHYPSEDCALSLLGESWGRCGVMRPAVVTSSYLSNNTVLFSHFGCKEPVVLLEFHVSTRRGVRVLNVPLEVVSSQHPLQEVLEGLQIRPVRVHPSPETTLHTDAFDLTITFPPHVFTDMCLYSLEFLPGVFPVPEYGRVFLPQNVTRIPCGLAPLVPLSYTKDASFNGSLIRDYVLVRMWPRDLDNTPALFGIVEIQFHHEDSIPTVTNVGMPISLDHSGYTPVPSSVLLPKGVSLSNVPKRVRLLASVTNCGLLIAHPLPTNLYSLSSTLLTSADLVSASVTFYPFSNSCLNNTSVYAYDIAGTLLWRVSFSVFVNVRYAVKPFEYVLNGSLPVNVTDSLATVGSSFGSNCTLILFKPPLIGSLHWLSSETPLSAGSHVSTHSTRTMLYSSSSSKSDRFVWMVECGSSVSQIATFVTVTPLKEDPPLSSYFIKEHINMYFGYAVQLSSHILQVNMAEKNDFELVFVLFPDHDVSFYLISDPAPPETLLPVSKLFTLYNSTEIKDFTHSQLVSGLVWLAPKENVTNRSQFGINLGDSSFKLFPVNINAILPPTARELFTPDVVAAATNRVFSLNHLSSLNSYVTLSSLIVRAARRNITYRVSVPPRYGAICYSDQFCNPSLSNFTQADVASGRVRYVQNIISRIDGFLFEIDGFSPQWVVINSSMSPCKPVPIYVPVDGNVTLRSSMFAEQLPKSAVESVLEFTIVMSPSYGWLSLFDDSTVLLADLDSGVLSYVVNASAIRPVPPDTVMFATVHNGAALFVELIFVHMEQQTTQPTVSAENIYMTVEEVELKDKVTLSNFPCVLSVVHFVMVSQPAYGQIIHKQRHPPYGTTVLSSNCTFSYESLQEGEIVYEIHRGRNTSAFSDKFDFTVTIPTVLSVDFPNGTFHLSLNYHEPQNLSIQFLEEKQRYGVQFNQSVWLPPGIPLNSTLVSFESERAIGSFQVGSYGELDALTWPEFAESILNSPMLYYLNNFEFTHDSIKVSIINKTTWHSLVEYSIGILWSVVYFQNATTHVEASSEGRVVSLQINYTGTVTMGAYIVVKVAEIPTGLTLSCPLDQLRPHKCTCINRPFTNVTLLSGRQGLEICSYVSANNSVGNFEDGPRLAFKLLGYQGAIPRRGKDVAVVNVQEYSSVQFDVSHYPGYGESNSCYKSVEVNKSIGVLSLQLVRSGNLRNRVGIICYTKRLSLYFQSFNERDRNEASSVVYFSENSSTAFCNVTVNEVEHDHTVRFILSLAKMDRQYAKPVAGRESVCVFIKDNVVYRPTVFFREKTRTFNEPDRENVIRIIVMHRNVSRKRGHQTTTVTYRTAGGNAVPWIDYVPILNGTALFFGTQGLFHIPLTLLVNQEDFEEDKDFFIEITSVEDGVVSQGKDRVRIVIQDDLVKIGFESLNITFREDSNVVHIPVLRTGNLSRSTDFVCIPSVTQGYSRPYVNPPSFTLYKHTFNKGENSTFCKVALVNDQVFTESKQFKVEMNRIGETVGSNHILQRLRIKPKVITVFVTDDDKPVVQFNTTHQDIMMSEPLSNCSLDKVIHSIKISREGDTEKNITVRVVSSASSDIFSLLNPEVVFPPGESFTYLNLTISRLPRDQSSNNFNLSLLPYSRDVSQTDSSFLLGDKREVSVTVTKADTRGVLFPGLPVVKGSGSSHPLKCIAPCTDTNQVTDDTCVGYCDRVNVRATQYGWEESVHGVHFTPVCCSSWLASTESSTLDPVFLKHNHFYRCTVSATDVNGVRNGQVRVSKPYKVVLPDDKCSSRPLPQVTISTGRESDEDGKSIVVSPSDVVKVRIQVGSIDNLYPLLSTARFQSNFTLLPNDLVSESSHRCSNFLPGMHSLLGENAFVPPPRISSIREASLAQCLWTFESWHVVSDLLSSCGTAKFRKFNLTFHVLYFGSHCGSNNTTASVSKTLFLNRSSPCSTAIPVKTLLTTSSTPRAEIEVLALRNWTTLGQQVLILRSKMLRQYAHQQLLPNPSVNLLPIHDHSVGIQLVASEDHIQLWTVRLGIPTGSANLSILFKCSNLDCPPQLFSLTLEKSDHSSPYYTVGVAADFVVKTKGRDMTAVLSVSQHNVLKDNVRLCMVSLRACHVPEQGHTHQRCIHLAGDSSLGKTGGKSFPGNCSGVSPVYDPHSHSRSNPSVEVKFQLSQLSGGQWSIEASYTFIKDSCPSDRYYAASEAWFSFPTSATPATPSEGINHAYLVVPAVLTSVITIVAAIVVVGVVLYTHCKAKAKAQKSTGRQVSSHTRTTRIIRTRITPTGSEEFELSQIVTKGEDDPNLCVALALEGSKDKKRKSFHNFSSLPVLPVIQEETASQLSSVEQMAGEIPPHTHHAVRLSSDFSPLPGGQFVICDDAQDDIRDSVLDYLAISAPTPSVSRTRLQSDL